MAKTSTARKAAPAAQPQTLPIAAPAAQPMNPGLVAQLQNIKRDNGEYGILRNPDGLGTQFFETRRGPADKQCQNCAYWSPWRTTEKAGACPNCGKASPFKPTVPVARRMRTVTPTLSFAEGLRAVKSFLEEKDPDVALATLQEAADLIERFGSAQEAIDAVSIFAGKGD